MRDPGATELVGNRSGGDPCDRADKWSQEGIRERIGRAWQRSINLLIRSGNVAASPEKVPKVPI